MPVKSGVRGATFLILYRPTLSTGPALRQALTPGWCVRPLLRQIFLITPQNWRAQISQPRKGVSSIKSLSKEPNRIFSKLIKLLVFNLIGLFNFFFFIKEKAKSIPVFHTSSWAETLWIQQNPNQTACGLGNNLDSVLLWNWLNSSIHNAVKILTTVKRHQRKRKEIKPTENQSIPTYFHSAKTDTVTPLWML